MSVNLAVKQKRLAKTRRSILYNIYVLSSHLEGQGRINDDYADVAPPFS